MLEEIFDTLGIERYKNFDEEKIKQIINGDEKNKKWVLLKELDETVDLHKFSILVGRYHDILREIQWRENAPKRAYQEGYVMGLKEQLGKDKENIIIKIALQKKIPVDIIADVLNIPEEKVLKIQKSLAIIE